MEFQGKIHLVLLTYRTVSYKTRLHVFPPPPPRYPRGQKFLLTKYLFFKFIFKNFLLTGKSADLNSQRSPWVFHPKFTRKKSPKQYKNGAFLQGSQIRTTTNLLHKQGPNHFGKARFRSLAISVKEFLFWSHRLEKYFTTLMDTQRDVYFEKPKLLNFRAWAKKQGQKIQGHFGYVWPNYCIRLNPVSPLSMVLSMWLTFDFRLNTYNSQITPKYDIGRKEFMRLPSHVCHR